MKKLFTALVLGLAALGAAAQAWPTKPVTLVVPFPPGGSTDYIARAIGPSLTSKFGQTFIVDNKAGATGTIGAAAVKRSAPRRRPGRPNRSRWSCRSRPAARPTTSPGRSGRR